MRFITLKEILILYNKIINESGGSYGIRDIKLLESALVQPFMMFDGKYLYKTLIDKATALLYSLIMNHPFIDGNKRTGHAATEIFFNINKIPISKDGSKLNLSIYLYLDPYSINIETYQNIIKIVYS